VSPESGAWRAHVASFVASLSQVGLSQKCAGTAELGSNLLPNCCGSTVELGSNLLPNCRGSASECPLDALDARAFEAAGGT